MRYFAEHAWVDNAVAEDVLIEVERDAIDAVTSGVDRHESPDAITLPGMVFPGFANCHSHAFHRALRGRTNSATGSFWTWRESMLAIADRLNPDGYLALATAVFAEMVLAGYTSVGEFHYLHHGRGGTPYDDPNAMAEVLREAASNAGIRLTILDAAYLSGGLGAAGHQQIVGPTTRFADRDIDAWADRVAMLKADANTRIGVAAHSVRAVPAAALTRIVEVAAGRPLHVHVAEQPAENVAVKGFYGTTAIQLLAQRGFWSATSTAVHATHPTVKDIRLLGDSGSNVCFAPTTERDLADGIGPARGLRDAGCGLSIGSDQHVVIDPFEELRAVELHERLISNQRGRFAPTELIDVATRHDSIGWPEVGRIAPGIKADLVAVRTDSVRTAGVALGELIFAATAADIDTVVVGGEIVVMGGRHRLGDVARQLAESIDPLWF